MGHKPRPPAPPVDPDSAFVAELGEQTARDVFADQAAMRATDVADLAHEAWWNVAMYECEMQGLDIDDSALEDEYTRALVAEYQRLQRDAGTTPPSLVDVLRAKLVAAKVPAGVLARFDVVFAAADLEKVDMNQPAREIVFEAAPKLIRAQPDAPVFETVRDVLVELGHLESGILRRAIETFMYAGLSERNEVTSLGRYVATLPFERVFPHVTARQRVSYYATLLLEQARDVFDAHAAEIYAEVDNRDGWQLDLTETMLRVDKHAYEHKVLAWARGLEDCGLRCHMAIYLSRAFADRHRELIFELARGAIADFGDEDSSAAQTLLIDPLLAPYAEFPNSSVKLCLVATLLDTFGKGAYPVIAGYRDRNKGWMIRYYELLGRFLPGDPEIAAVLVDGLLTELPRGNLGGMLTYEGYVERMIGALTSYDLSAFRDAVTAKFAGEPSPTIAAAVAGLVAAGARVE